MSEATVTVHGLVCHDHVDMAIASFSSLLEFSANPLQITIHDDGSLTSGDVEKLRCGIKDSILITRSEADARVNSLLKNYPNSYKFRQHVPHAVKLLDIALLTQDDIAFCDSDILFLRPFKDLFFWPDAQTSALFMMDYLEAYSVFPWHLIGLNRLKLPSKVNSGLIFMRGSAYDLDFVEWFLGKRAFQSKPLHKMEQTCWAALGHRAGCRLWNPEQIALIRPWSTPEDGLVAGHFVKEIRYRFNEFLTAKGAKPSELLAVKVETIPSADCDILGLAQNHLVRQTNRVRSYQRKLPDLIHQKLFRSS